MVYGLLLFFSSFSLGEQLFPVNNSLLNYTHVLFEWQQIDNTSQYQIQLAKEDSFTEIIVDVLDSTLIYIDKNNINWASEYYWRVRSIDELGLPRNWIDTLQFQTDERRYDVNIDITSSEINKLVIFSNWGGGYSTGVIDKNGNEIWHDKDEFMMYSIDTNGQIFGGQLWDDDNLWITGVKFDFIQGVLWRQKNTLPFHHDLIQIPNGNYLGIQGGNVKYGPIPYGDWITDFQEFGYTGDGISNEFLWSGGKIVEIDFESSDELRYWDPFNFYKYEDFDALGGTWSFHIIATGIYDWLHTNSIDFHDDIIYVSQRNISRISKIKYPEWEVVWNMGIMDTHQSTNIKHICPELKFTWQHDVKMTNNGNILILDNGSLSQTIRGTESPKTRILKIEVLNDESCNILWEYEFEPNLYSSAMGSIQQLINGNYFVSLIGGEGVGKIIEIDPNKDFVWSATLSFVDGRSDPIYRAYSMSGIHPTAFSVFKSPHLLSSQNNNLTATIYNESTYNQYFLYTISSNRIDSCLFEIDLSINLKYFHQEKKKINFLYESCQPTVSDVLEKNGEFILEINKKIDIDLSIIFEELDVGDLILAPKQFLLTSFPNPFNSSVAIKFTLPFYTEVLIKVYNIEGKELISLIDEPLNSGEHDIFWNAEFQTSGIYFIKMIAGEITQTKKIMLIK